MPTRRMIEPAIWQSESMGRLTIRQRLMFIGMFSNADDQGRLRASAPVIRSMIFPFDDISLDDIESDIKAIEAEACVILYGQNGARFAQVINWWIYQQHQWAYPSKIPKADGWSDRLRFRQGGQVITENWDTKRPSIDQNRIEVPKAIGKGLGKDKRKATPKGESAKPPTPPQIESYRKAAHRYPNKSLYPLICEHVKDDTQSLFLFEQIVTGWIAKGWNPANITGILEFVDRGEVPQGNGNGNGQKSNATAALERLKAKHVND